MTLEKMQVAIGQCLRIGVCIAFVMVMIGGSFYLLEHGGDKMPFAQFSTGPTTSISVSEIVHSALHFSSIGAIQLGLITLVLVQFVRVALTLGMFVVLRERIFVLISLFVLAVLIISLFASP